MFRHNIAIVALLVFAPLSQAGADSYFEQRIHDFGATPRGPQLVHYFRFTNTSKDVLTISNVRVSCGCVTASAPVTQVKPGESSYITAQMDSRRFSGPKSVTVYVQFSTPRFEEVSLQVTANGRDDFSMTPESIAFGTIRKGAEASASIQVKLVGDPNWNITELKCESNFVKPVAKLVNRGNAEVTFEITASVRPDLPIGKWYTDVWLSTTNASLSKVRVPLHIDVMPAVTATPALLQLGDIKVGDNVDQKVLVKGEKPFKIKSVQGTDGIVSVTGAGTDAKVLHILTVTVKPSAIGDITKDLSVVTDENDETIVAIPIRAKAIKD